MLLDDWASHPQHERRRTLFVVLVLAVAALWGAWQFLRSATPRHIVLASGAPDGMYHELAQRYKEILARDGVTVEERLTSGAGENIQLLNEPGSGVDVAFVIAGVATPAEASHVEMLASLNYEPLWIFYRSADTLTQLDELRTRRVAIGPPGLGVRALAMPLLAANGVTQHDTDLLPLGNIAALRALQAGEIDAALFSGPVQSPAVWQALHDPAIKLMSLPRAAAYQRRFAHITRLTLPPGTIDLALRIPAQEVSLIATRAMLVARDDLPKPLINLLFDAAHELHGGQGYFEAAGEFPGTARLDLTVSADADRHHRFGPSLLNRYLPFWAATLVERLIVVVLPLIVIAVPLINLMPQLIRWRVRSRIYRWYGELTLLERDVAARTGDLPIERWLADIDRIEQAAERIRTPVRFASESYTLREHIGLVRRAVLAKADGAPQEPPADRR